MKLLVGTRKGAFILTSNAARKDWKLSEPIFLGHIVNHLVADARQPGVMLMAAKTGHLGPTVFRSTDSGKSWKESKTPPQFRSQNGKANSTSGTASADASGDTSAPKPTSPAEIDAPAGTDSDTAKGALSVEKVFWLSAGHASEKAVWYAGTSPGGLFRTTDNGETWAPVEGFNDNPNYKKWIVQGGTPDGDILHSVVIDPRDAKHMYVSVSSGGTFETTDQGKTWKPINAGVAADFIPVENPEYGHDPHCMVAHPQNPDRLYQQNHCGIYRLDRPATKWIRIGDNMPREVGDIGFPIVLHPRNQDCAWVFPMDGTEVWPRTSPGGKPATYVTRDAGQSWSRQDKGLPLSDAYFTVKRQSMTGDSLDPVGLYFGTTSGEIWSSSDEGETWSCIARHLPEIYSLTIDPT
jgi:photosystem II stability/assembly factor-like uncharacterized protein